MRKCLKLNRGFVIFMLASNVRNIAIDTLGSVTWHNVASVCSSHHLTPPTRQNLCLPIWCASLFATPQNSPAPAPSRQHHRPCPPGRAIWWLASLKGQNFAPVADLQLEQAMDYGGLAVLNGRPLGSVLIWIGGWHRRWDRPGKEGCA